MAVPTMAIYTAPPITYDFDINNRSSSTSSTASVSSSQKLVGGLSSLFSDESPSSKTGEELSSSFTSCLKRDHFHQSPVSVFHGPVSLTSTPSLRFSPRFSSSFRMQVSLAEELTFIMDDNQDNDYNLNFEPYVKDMLLTAQLKHDIFRDELVVKAFYEAAKAHKGQMRASGDPYLQHCVETASLLATIGANSTVVSVGLLHDTCDDSFMSYDYILQTFGSELADLVEKVSKLSELSKLARESYTATKAIEADRMHTMFLAMPDARAVLIKLADRLHNMMTLDALPLSKQYRFAKETMEIFAPLANRLGIVSWKEQLENLCFKYINPQQYKDLSSQLFKSFNQSVVTCAAQKLERALKDGSVSYHALNWRHKSLYSIHCKMLKKKLSMDEIHDIYGLRLIVENVDDCYNVLHLVHSLWSQVPGMFKDYINHPKCNGYQSLHTIVMGEGLVPLEVQIRTKEMHLQAEFGFAAHWRYKEGDCMHSSFVVQMVEWARWVITWQCETMVKDLSAMKPQCKFPFHSEDCVYSYKASCGSDGPVFVIVIENHKMSVQEFAANSTVKDVVTRAGLTSRMWAPYGFPIKQELMPKVNHEPVSDFSCQLKMGDVVELTPKIPDKSLTEYREEIQRMYESGNVVNWR